MTHEYNGFNDPATINDPDHSNQISAADCGLLLERIYRRTFGSRQICNEVEERDAEPEYPVQNSRRASRGCLVGTRPAR